MSVNYSLQHPQIDNVINDQIEICLNSLGDFDFNFAELDGEDSRNFMIISNKPEWYDAVYKKNNCQRIDPVTLRARVARAGGDFAWSSGIMGLEWGDQNIFVNAAKFDINKGHTFFTHDQYGIISLFTLILKRGLQRESEHAIAGNKGVIFSLLRRCHMINFLLRGGNGNTSSGASSRLCYSPTSEFAGQGADFQDTVLELLYDAGYAITKK